MTEKSGGEAAAMVRGAEVLPSGRGGPGIIVFRSRASAALGATIPHPSSLECSPGLGRRAVAVRRYFHSAGVSLGWAEATRAAMPPT